MGNSERNKRELNPEILSYTVWKEINATGAVTADDKGYKYTETSFFRLSWSSKLGGISTRAVHIDMYSVFMWTVLLCLAASERFVVVHWIIKVQFGFLKYVEM